MMESSALIESRTGSVAWLRINRPAKRNAINGEVIEGMLAALDRLRGDAEVGCVVITGEGDASFSVGLDFNYLLRRHQEGVGPDYFDMLKALWEFPKILIAAVNGYCLGGGISLICACDLAIASDRAQFGLPEVVHGGPPGLAVGAVLRTVARKHAVELNLMGKRTWDAVTAERRGLINAVAPHAELTAVAQQWASEIAECPPTSIEYCKRIYHDVPDKTSGYLEGIRMTRQLAQEQRAGSSAFDDGLKAFLGGRRINFTKSTP